MNWKTFIHKCIASEISRITKYYDLTIQWLPLENDNGEIFDLLQSKQKRRITSHRDFPDIKTKKESRAVVFLNGNLNHSLNIQSLLEDIKDKINRTTRVVIVIYNPYYRWLYWFANRLGLRKGETPTTFVTKTDLANIATLSGFDLIRIKPIIYFPWKLLGIGTLINYFMPIIPFFRWFGLAAITVLRPKFKENEKLSLSIIIPARNESGNIENAMTRLKFLKEEKQIETEIIFVEGHSKDDTWDKIEQAKKKYNDLFRIYSYKQTGMGKCNAVRIGLSKANNELLTILDADLTTPPELLFRFYEAYSEGHADFINGSRLVYPMEGEAMRFLNRLGNVFFAKALSFVLDVRLGDSLCGTKLFTRHDYERMVRWREDFGNFDPFGDYELLFPAAILGLGIIDVPIHYRTRTYGQTNIHRFRHGWQLLQMVFTGLFRVKVGPKI